MNKATAKQIQFCNDLIDAGASFDLKMPHEDSFEAADAFIKKNYHFGRKTERYFAKCQENSVIRPEDYNIPNH